MAYHHWTKEDVKILKKEIKNSPSNLQNAFRKVAKKTDRSTDAVEKYYYKFIRNKESKALFLLFSPKKSLRNYKITRKGKYATKNQKENNKPSKWKRILAILAE